MQIRCTYCQTMIPISRDEMLAALQQMEFHKQVFYDAHCTKCRRSNRVERRKIELLMPNWKKVIKDMQHEAEGDVKAVELTDKTQKPGKKTPGQKESISKKTDSPSGKKTKDQELIPAKKKAKIQ